VEQATRIGSSEHQGQNISEPASGEVARAGHGRRFAAAQPGQGSVAFPLPLHGLQGIVSFPEHARHR
jgi:hypothetical protein